VRAVCAAAVLALLATACGGRNPPIQQRFYAFGTIVDVTLYGVDQARAKTLANAMKRHLDAWHRHWHPWHGDGLAAINRAFAAKRPAPVDEDLADLIRRARRLEIASSHRFDPAIGGLIKLWGFDSESDPNPTSPPPADAIGALVRAAPRLTDVNVTDGHIATTNPAVRIDLGAFAKGVAVGRLVSYLRKQGVPAGIVDAGGDLQTFGRPGDRAWRIGVRDPEGKGVIAAVSAGDGDSVFTSGDYERYFTDGGVRYHHILNPESGRPARGTHSVTVVTRDPGLADAAATALFVAGPKHWRETATRMGVDTAMLIDQRGRVHMTPAMRDRVRFTKTPAPRVIVEP